MPLPAGGYFLSLVKRLQTWLNCRGGDSLLGHGYRAPDAAIDADAQADQHGEAGQIVFNGPEDEKEGDDAANKICE